MSKLKKIKNGEYIGGDKYTVTPDAGGKSKIVFSPDSILIEPTPVGAEILNEMQLNEVYTLDTVRSVDGQKEIYTATLEGFTEFDNPDLNFNLKINSENTNSQTYLRLNNIDYLIECKIGNLKAGSIVYAKKINNTIKIIGNKNFGTNEGDILEGSKLAEILGIEYAGILNNTNAKVAGKGYYDTANKKIYKCTANTSINYADAAYFIEVSNNDLLGKLQNLGSNLLLSDKTLTVSNTQTVDGIQFSVSVKSYLYNNRIKYETIEISASDSIVEGKTYSVPVPTSAEIPAKYWGYGDLSMDSPNNLCIAQTIKSPAIILITCLKKIYSGSGTTMRLTYIR